MQKHTRQNKGVGEREGLMMMKGVTCDGGDEGERLNEEKRKTIVGL